MSTASVSGCSTIVVMGQFGVFEEGPLNSAAYPGMNVQMGVATDVMGRHYWSPGSTDYIGTGTGQTTVHGSVKVLREDALQGNTVADAYASGDNAFIYIPRSGDIIQVLVTSGQTVAKGDPLTAQSTGKWNVDATNGTVEALESSGGSLSGDKLMRVRVL